MAMLDASVDAIPDQPCHSKISFVEESLGTGTETGEALRHVRALLKEQSIRNKVEMDRLLRQLVSKSAGMEIYRPDDVARQPARQHDQDPCNAAWLNPQGNQLQDASDVAKLKQSKEPRKNTDPGDEVAQGTRSSGNMPASKSDSAHWRVQAVLGIEPMSTFKTSSNIEFFEHALEELVKPKAKAHKSPMDYILSCLHFLEIAQEPERKGLLARGLNSNWFRGLCGFCIALNAVFLLLMTDYEMAHLGQEAPGTMMYVEMSFVGFYFIELILKLYVHRLYLFWCEDYAWNTLDVMLVATSLIELAFATFLRGAASGVNVSFMRLVRLFKLARVLRIARTVHFLAELRVVFDCLLGSIISCVWSMVMIVIMVYMFSLLIVQGLSQELSSGGSKWSDAEELRLYHFFGSVGTGMVTLIQSTTGGINWAEVFELLMEGNVLLGSIFCSYILFFVLAVWNIVTSLFVDKAIKLAQPDLDSLAAEKSAQDAEDFQTLTKIFDMLDIDGSGTISLQEFHSIMDHPKFRRYLRARGIEVTDAELLRSMLMSVAGNSDPDVDINFIVAACLRMKGSASSIDLHALSFQSKLMTQALTECLDHTVKKLEQIELTLAAVAPPTSKKPCGESFYC